MLGEIVNGNAEYKLDKAIYRILFGKASAGVCISDLSWVIRALGIKMRGRKRVKQAVVLYNQVEKDLKALKRKMPKRKTFPACFTNSEFDKHPQTGPTENTLAHERLHVSIRHLEHEKKLEYGSCGSQVNKAIEKEFGAEGKTALMLMHELGLSQNWDTDGEEVLARVAEIKHSCGSKNVCSDAKRRLDAYDEIYRRHQARFSNRDKLKSTKSITKVADKMIKKYKTPQAFAKKVINACAIDLKRKRR